MVQILHPSLTGYLNLEFKMKYFLFVVITVLYSTILYAKSFLIGVICSARALHKPMYVFLCNLFVNEFNEMSLIYCYLQIFCLYTYAMIEFCNLTVMYFDRYVSICYPLQYNRIMTPFRVVWCDNYLLVKLACSKTYLNSTYGIYVYVMTKVLSTCAPHIISLLNFSLSCFFETIQSRFDNIRMPALLGIIISVYFLMCQPVLNPIMYGMRLKKK
uniref:Olfactory receptor n=1 Tax=Cyprinus carpio TaxID=7962 RepID=A0A8C1NSA4_CYPCA